MFNPSAVKICAETIPLVKHANRKYIVVSNDLIIRPKPAIFLPNLRHNVMEPLYNLRVGKRQILVTE
jgi:hypothetical protein